MLVVARSRFINPRFMPWWSSAIEKLPWQDWIENNWYQNQGIDFVTSSNFTLCKRTSFFHVITMGFFSMGFFLFGNAVHELTKYWVSECIILSWTFWIGDHQKVQLFIAKIEIRSSNFCAKFFELTLIDFIVVSLLYRYFESFLNIVRWNSKPNSPFPEAFYFWTNNTKKLAILIDQSTPAVATANSCIRLIIFVIKEIAMCTYYAYSYWLPKWNIDRCSKCINFTSNYGFWAGPKIKCQLF